MKSAIFTGIIGHESAVEALERSAANKRLAHAYLFVGPEGVGRTTVAQQLIDSVLETGSVLNTMVIERLVDEKTSKRKSVVSVNQIRQVQERISKSALGGGKQAVLILEADRMHKAAANALLKTLEEPKADAILILRASSVESVPATIASRCQILRFNRVANKIIEAALVKKGIAHDDAGRCATLSLGRPGLALRLMTDGALRSQIETAASSLVYLVKEGLPSRFKSISDLLPKGEANKAEVASIVLDGWEQALRDLMLRSVGCTEMTMFTKDEELDSLSKTKAVGLWLESLDRLTEARLALRHNGNPLLALEHVALTF